MRRRGTAIAAADGRRGRYAGPLFAAAVVVVGLAATVLTVAGLRAAQRANADRVMDQRTDMARAAVLAETERYRSLVEAVATGLATDDTITWEGFDAASAPLATARLIGATSVAFVVPSRTDQIAATQRLWRSRGSDGLVLRPFGTGDEHYFGIFTRALHTASPPGPGAGSSPVPGGDLAAAAEPSAALADARRMSRPAVSDTYVLLRDRNLPKALQQRSFVFAAPIWPRAADPQFRGWVVLGMRGQDFLSGVLATVSQGQLDAELLAPNGGDRSVVAAYTVPGAPDLERSRRLEVADREWTLITRAQSGNLPGARSSLPGAVLGGGLAITLILASLVYVLATGRSRAWARVEKATAELRTAEAESRRQAGLLGAIMTSLGDGVGVVDEDGSFLLHNPAAQQLMGVDDEVGGPDDWQRHYGLYRPDGHTPFPVDELPVMRALRGESSDGVEMVIRNRARPEGILISVDGRPLDPSAGQRGAVAVFHDITELRRYETDLAVFAGVVAHDLKAPLTVVRGHCEAAGEALDDGLADRARHSLDRMMRAVERMSSMIDTLLAYTTARDAPLRAGPVDLVALVAEVVQDRTAHLPAGGRPEVHLGPLPAVLADPAMLRHVLENLIGNAFKYVRPGASAWLEVTATAGPPGLARIEIADRGIGIPESDKPVVFERFHRAHAADGYAGTGLGLAICKRIVERHGGEIGVADNPGGGTRFHFTLPLTEEETEEEAGMSTDDEQARARLERALAERAAMADLAAGPAAEEPAAEEPAAEEPAAKRPAGSTPVPPARPGRTA